MVKRWIARVIRLGAARNKTNGRNEENSSVKCQGCENTFKKSIQNKRFCSGSCYQKYRRSRRKKIIKKDTKVCDVCNKDFIPDKTTTKRCSLKCRAIHSRRYFEERWNKYREVKRKQSPIISQCGYCKKEFIVLKANQVYCSHLCRANNRKLRIKREKLLPAPRLREVTEEDINSSKYSNEIRAYKKSGKKIISFPHQPQPESFDVFINDIGTDNEKYTDDLENFNTGIKNGKFPRK